MASTTTTIRRHIIQVEVVGDANLKRFQSQAEAVGARIRALNASTRAGATGFGAMGASSAALGRNLQNASFQIQDFAVQVASGTAATRALAQQLPQMLIGFGAWGAAIGAMVAVGAALAPMLGEIGINAQNAAQLLGSFAPVVNTITDAVKTLGSVSGSVFGVLVQNLDRILYYGTALAVVFGARMAAGFITASRAVTVLVGTFGVLRTAVLGLVRIMPQLLAAFAIGELIHRLMNLVENVGGFGNALSALGAVARQIWEAMKSDAEGLGLALNSVWLRIQAGFLSMVEKIYTAWANLMSTLSGFATSAAGVLGPVWFDWNPFADAAAGLKELSAEAEKAATATGATQAALISGAEASAGASSAAFERSSRLLYDAGTKLKNLWEETKGAATDLGGATAGLEEGMKGVGAAAGGAGKEIEKVAGGVTKFELQLNEFGTTVSSSFDNAFRGLIDGTRSAADAFHEMILSMVQDITMLILSKQFQELLLALSRFGGFGWLSDLVPAPAVPGGALRAMGAPGRDGDVGLGSRMMRVVAPPLSQTMPGLGSGGYGGGLTVNINNSVPDADVRASERRDPMGRRVLDVAIVERLTGAIRSGALDPAFSSAYGLRRRAR